MGVISHFSCNSKSTWDNWDEFIKEKDKNTTPNPNPYRFKIIKTQTIGKFLIVLVNYPDCTTYNGDKILIYKNKTEDEIKQVSILDPHFLNKDNDPLIRVSGNERGWKLAEEICLRMTDGDK